VRKMLLLGAGGAIGYVLGAKAGTARYESLKDKATTVKERSPELMHKARELRGKGEDVLEDVSTKVANARESGSGQSKSPSPIDVAATSNKSVSQGAN